MSVIRRAAGLSTSYPALPPERSPEQSAMLVAGLMVPGAENLATECPICFDELGRCGLVGWGHCHYYSYYY